jgi:tyrosine-protein kinase Etk/Wzc
MMLNIPSEDQEISFLDILQVLVDNLKLLVIGPLVAGLLALGYSYTIVPTFTSTTKILSPQQPASAANLIQSLGLMGGGSGVKNPTEQYVSFLRSRNLQEPLIERFKLLDRYKLDSIEDACNLLDRRIKITTGKDGIIRIEASDFDPVFAAQLANGHVEELSNLLNRIAVTESQQRRLFFENQLAITKSNFLKAEKLLKSSGISSDLLKLTPMSALENISRLQSNIMANEIKLATMQRNMTDSAPEYKAVQAELIALRMQISRVEKEQPLSLASNDEFTSRLREYKSQEALIDYFSKQYDMARIDESREGATVQILDAAKPPKRKTSPQKMNIAIIASIITGFILLIYIFMINIYRRAKLDDEFAAKIASINESFFRLIGRHS